MFLMTEEEIAVTPAVAKKSDPHTELLHRIERTLVACFAGIITGIISFFIVGDRAVSGINQATILALLIMIAAILVQKNLFILMKIDPGHLSGKDWFYQGFMTFAFWFITWTILLTEKMQVK